MNFLRPFAAFLIVASGASAEDVMITEPDGTAWSSYTANAKCIEVNVRHTLGDKSHINTSSNSISGLVTDEVNNTIHEIFVFMRPSSGDVSSVIERITSRFNNYRPDPDRNNENHSYSERYGVLSYIPYQADSVVHENAEKPQQPERVEIRNRESVVSGYGPSDYDVEPVIRQLDERLRICDLGF
ncbi:MAG: hypothetical protein AAF988_04850 [Pseudomonadota bacterium]